jgi:hypothetical protein
MTTKWSEAPLKAGGGVKIGRPIPPIEAFEVFVDEKFRVEEDPKLPPPILHNKKPGYLYLSIYSIQSR